MSLQPADPDYYFRVDAHVGLRNACGDTLFRPARWPHDGTGWKHAELIAAAANIPTSEAIYRISFWVNEHEARNDLTARGWLQPHVMLRVSRASVAQALDGWTFGVDDFLPGQADLIWRRTERAGDRFFDGGIPMDCFEVWESHGWRPWHQAEAVQPDGVRLARAGWQPLALLARQGPVMAHWCTVLHRPPGAPPEPWCLLTLDERSPGSLGSNTAAVQQAAELLLDGPLRMVAHHLGGLLTIHVTPERLWTEQYAVAFVPPSPPQSPSWHQRLRHIHPPEQPSHAWVVKPHWRLSRAQEYALIRSSGLRQARPEARGYAWGMEE